MRVLMLTDTAQFSGAEEAMMNLAKLLSTQEGIDLRLVTTRFKESTIPILPFEDSLTFNEFRPKNIEGLYDILARPRNLSDWIRHVRRIAHEFRPNVIHSGILFSIIPGLIAARDLGIPNIAHVHDYRSLSLTDLPFLNGSVSALSLSKELGVYLRVSSARRALLGLGLRRALNFLLNRCDLVIAVSNFHKNALSGFLKPPVRVLRNVGYNFENVNNVQKKVSEKAIVFGGRLSLAKGFPIFLEAADRLVRDPDIQIHIAGSGDLSHLAELFVKTHKNSTYHGQLSVEKFHELVASSQLTVHPSLSPEPSPMSVVASVNLGTTAIGSRRGGLIELLPPRYLFEPSVDSIVAKVLGFFDRPTEYPARLALELDPNDIAKQAIELYHKISRIQN